MTAMTLEFFYGGAEPPTPKLTLAAPPPSDWCFDCMRQMLPAGTAYVCEGCGNCQWKPTDNSKE